MVSVKELRVRIHSVGNIKQITRAMEMVATTKLRRFQDRAVSSRPYAQEIAGLVGRLTQVLGDEVAERPLFQKGGGDKTLALLVTSDRGLCGAYNSNMFRELEDWLAARSEAGRGEDSVSFFVYGRKGAQYLTKRGLNVASYLTEPPLEALDFQAAAVASRMLQEEFLSGAYDEVVVLSTAFESMVKYVPAVNPFLPVSPDALKAEDGPDSDDSADGDVILEPDAGVIFDRLVPRYLETRIYNALLESLTSEYASKRFAMKNATEAANDMQKLLRGIYNRKRQENITKELLDIVGGAEALK